MTGPIDETTPLDGALTGANLVDDLDELTDEELSARSWQIINEARRRLREQRPAIEGPKAWEHVEALVDLAIAERAQRAVDRIVARKRRECSDD